MNRSADGVLIIDKPSGITSRSVDNQVRRHFGRKTKVGHAGTLDPFATGVLPVMIGEATKLSPFLTGCEKEYTGLLRLGRQTDTADLTGEVTAEAPVPAFTLGQVEAAVGELTGTFSQRVPAYAAVRVDGVRLYELARRGEAVEAPERDVTVLSWQVESCDADSISFRVTCAAGTYVRSLAEALAAKLGTVGFLETLRRTRVGNFQIEQARPLDGPPEEFNLIELSDALDLPGCKLTAAQVRDVRYGKKLSLPFGEGVTKAKVVDEEGRLVAVMTPAPRSSEEPCEWQVVRGFYGREAQ